MYAILKTGGKQYKVEADQIIDRERVTGDAGDKVVFDEILAVSNDKGELNVGAPVVEKATVEAEILSQFRGKKLVVFKMKRRKGYRRKKGHRQELTKVKITAIKG